MLIEFQANCKCAFVLYYVVIADRAKLDDPVPHTLKNECTGVQNPHCYMHAHRAWLTVYNTVLCIFNARSIKLHTLHLNRIVLHTLHLKRVLVLQLFSF